MIIIVKNQTASPITINSLSIVDKIIPALGQSNLSEFNNLFAILANDELKTLIDNDQIIFNIDGSDLTKTQSVNFLRLDLSFINNTSFVNVITLDGIIGPISYNENQNDFTDPDLATSNYLLLNPMVNNKNITGITAPAIGVNQLLFIMNINDVNKTVLKNNSGNSSSNNRFLFKKDITLEENEGCVILYDHNASKWRCVAKSA